MANPMGTSGTASGQDLMSVAPSEVPAAYREALARAKFPAHKLREFSRIPVGRVAVDFLLAFASLAAVPVLYRLLPHPLTFVVCFVLSIRTFNCFAQLVHASDHGGLLPRPRLNMLAGSVCAWCLGYTRTGHRLAHLEHHLYLNTEKDPDRIWGAPEQTARELVGMWLRDVCVVTALGRLLQYSQSSREGYRVAPWRSLTAGFLARAALSLTPVIVTQSVILAFYSAVVGPVYYLLLYVLPIMTVYPAQIRLRSTVEHSFDVGHGPVTPQERWVSRSTRGSWPELLVFSPFGIHYHFEHHLFPGIPYPNLGKVQRLLLEHGVSVPIVPSYLTFVARKLRAERRRLASREGTRAAD